MNLTPDEYQALLEALLDAYRRYNSLKSMVRSELGDRLNEITPPTLPLKDNVDQLIDWAEEKGKLQALIFGAHRQNSGNPKLKQFVQTVTRERFIVDFIPCTHPIGPDINWRGKIEDLELQRFFQKQPDWYDVDFLMKAIEQAASVCKITIPSLKRKATGVLIAKDLVLTNYHVFKFDKGDDLQANASEAIIEFGCFGRDDSLKNRKNSFQLDRQEPILHYSPIKDLDYILLKVENDISQAKDIKPALWIVDNSPQTGIHLLQHPQGDSMKLSISNDGVTGIYKDVGLIQYVNKTAGGSSGSPCFDDDWQLVAIHHAERAKSFGSIREGILFSSIYQDLTKRYKNFPKIN